MAAALGLVPAIGVAVLAVRYRGLDPTQRVRVAWPLLAALLLVLLTLDDVLLTIDDPLHFVLDVAEAVALVLLPVSLAVGITRPDLFDVVGALRRTVVQRDPVGRGRRALRRPPPVLGVAVGGDDLRVAVVVAVIAALALDPLRRDPGAPRRAGSPSARRSPATSCCCGWATPWSTPSTAARSPAHRGDRDGGTGRAVGAAGGGRRGAGPGTARPAAGERRRWPPGCRTATTTSAPSPAVRR